MVPTVSRGRVGSLTALLDELHVTDDFDRLVGPISRLPASQYPRLLAIALLLRHSWSLYDLARTGTRLGLAVGHSGSRTQHLRLRLRSPPSRATRAPLSGPRPH